MLPHEESAILSRMTAAEKDGTLQITEFEDLYQSYFTPEYYNKFDILRFPHFESNSCVRQKCDHTPDNLIACNLPKAVEYRGAKTEELFPFIKTIPFTASEKIEGTLLIAYYHNGKWRCNTKNSFDSGSVGLLRMPEERVPAHKMNTDYTYLFIVSTSHSYGEDRDCIFQSYNLIGVLEKYNALPFPSHKIRAIGNDLGFSTPPSIPYKSFFEVVQRIARAKQGSIRPLILILQYRNGFVLKVSSETKTPSSDLS